MSSVRVKLVISKELFAEIVLAARRSAQSPTKFAAEILESAAAERRMDRLPPPEPVRSRRPRNPDQVLLRSLISPE